MKFEEFIKAGRVQKINPNYRKAETLLAGANARHKFLKDILREIGVINDHANFLVEQAYDVIMELIRSKMAKEGYLVTGRGAHEIEVSYIETLGFSELKVKFLDDLRYFRNGIKYRGKKFDNKFALEVMEFLNEVYPKLKN